MVHPDKCSHERAKEAFEVLNNANKDLLSEERRREVVHVLKMARGKCPPIKNSSVPVLQPMRKDARQSCFWAPLLSGEGPS